MMEESGQLEIVLNPFGAQLFLACLIITWKAQQNGRDEHNQKCWKCPMGETNMLVRSGQDRKARSSVQSKHSMQTTVSQHPCHVLILHTKLDVFERKTKGSLVVEHLHEIRFNLEHMSTVRKQYYPKTNKVTPKQIR